MTSGSSTYPARLAARSHTTYPNHPTLGWNNGTVLVLNADRAPNDEAIVTDPSAAYDVTQSMIRLLEAEAATSGMNYRATAHPGVSHGGNPLKRAIVIAEQGGRFAAVLPDGRKEDVTDDARAILDERLELVANKHPERPQVGSALPEDYRFAIPRPGEGVELLQEPMAPEDLLASVEKTREDVLASVENPDDRIALAHAYELFDHGADIAARMQRDRGNEGMQWFGL